MVVGLLPLDSHESICDWHCIPMQPGVGVGPSPCMPSMGPSKRAMVASVIPAAASGVTNPEPSLVPPQPTADAA